MIFVDLLEKASKGWKSSQEQSKMQLKTSFQSVGTKCVGPLVSSTQQTPFMVQQAHES